MDLPRARTVSSRFPVEPHRIPSPDRDDKLERLEKNKNHATTLINISQFLFLITCCEILILQLEDE